MASTDESDSATRPSSLSPSCRKCVDVLQHLVSGLTNGNSEESPPLTLLKAIGGGDPKKLRVEKSRDGVILYLPVETTQPHLLRKWTNFLGNNVNVDSRPIATSASDSLAESSPTNPLAIELKCRKCSTVGPEGGARAFLLGPTPLSVVICHNRVRSDPEELSEILTHELVHLYDVQKLKLDLQQCENLAYSEIRAAKAAECRNTFNPLSTQYREAKMSQVVVLPAPQNHALLMPLWTFCGDRQCLDDLRKQWCSDWRQNWRSAWGRSRFLKTRRSSGSCCDGCCYCEFGFSSKCWIRYSANKTARDNSKAL